MKVFWGGDFGFLGGGSDLGQFCEVFAPPPPHFWFQMKKGNTMQQFLQKALEILRRDFSELR